MAKSKVNHNVTANRESVLGVLATLEDPISGSTLVEAGLVKALTINEGVVRFVMRADWVFLPGTLALTVLACMVTSTGQIPDATVKS